MYAVVVSLRIRPGDMQEFLRLVRSNATASRREEPGCHRFDVVTDPDRPDEVLLYELYADAAAFDAHLASAHFAKFDAASAPMIAAKQVTTWREVAS